MAILHRTRKLTALVPRYAARFSCIGPACEDSCCSGWSVHLDKKTYKAYRQQTDTVLGPLMAQNVVREPDTAGANRYGVIRLQGPQQDCSLLEDRLCAVHKHLDESYLSDVCFSFPRATHVFAGQAEQALTLSCPEAARLALLAADAFVFTEAPIAVRGNTVATIQPQYGLSLEQMNETRILCLNLMRTEGLAIWQRLAILGVFCDELTRLIEDGRQAELPALLERTVATVENGELLSALDLIRPNHQAQAMVFATLWAAKGFSTISPMHAAMLERIARGLGADQHGQVGAAALVDAYVRGLARLDQALEHTPYLLGNYLLNDMFLGWFPLNGSSPYRNYLQLVARFGLLRFMLAAQCAADDEPAAPATLVSTVQLYCRRFEHDPVFGKEVNKSLEESGWGDLDKLFSFLRG
nr:flagellin lysine-N-methylase [uncultured Massilia sp.]